jgi:hypothetical protein
MRKVPAGWKLRTLPADMDLTTADDLLAVRCLEVCYLNLQAFQEDFAMFGLFRKRVQTADDLRAKEESQPDNQTELDIIQGCRALIGPSPRSLSTSDVKACRLSLTPLVEPIFVQSGDALLKVLREQDRLRDRGQVHWGCLVQANRILFDPQNPETLPANIVYSTDPFFDGRVSILTRIATGLFSQKGTTPADRELKEFVRVITDERERILRRELPRGYCSGRSVYFATTFIQPRHLPGNCLTRPAFPVLVNLQETEGVTILPHLFWPPNLVADWRS